MWKRILFAHDFSDCAGRIEPDVIDLALALSARVVVFHVSQIGYGLAPEALITPPGHGKPVRVDEFALGNAELRLSVIAEKMRARGVVVETHARMGDVCQGILRAADELSCDVIMMGTHGRKGLDHFLLGSVAEKVLRSADVPVITLRTNARREPLPEDQVLSDETVG